VQVKHVHTQIEAACVDKLKIVTNLNKLSPQLIIYSPKRVVLIIAHIFKLSQCMDLLILLHVFICLLIINDSFVDKNLLVY
jgi:hypothetical protein